MSDNRKKIFVAGGTGFLGKNIVERLGKDSIPYVSASLSQGLDFTDMKQVRVFFEKENPGIVINAAAAFSGGIQIAREHPGESFYNNTLISAYLIEASREFNVGLFVNIISNCSYPDVSDKKFKEEEWWDGPLHESVLAYGVVRKASWVNLWAYNKQYGLNSMSLILPNMYGPGDHMDEVRSHALGALVKKMVFAKRNGDKEVVIWGTGSPIREWLYIEDAVEAIMRSMSVEPIIDPINIGSGEGISIKDLAFLIKEIAGYEGELVFDTSRPDGAAYKVMDVERCKKIFNWIPSTQLKDGIEKTVEYFEKVL